MSFSVSDFLDELDAQIKAKHLLNHPFYQAWSQGKLSKECLTDYAKQYYQHVKAFPTYISAVHAHTEELETRKQLLDNLMEEEAGNPNHIDLWRDFIKSFGVSDEEINSEIPSLEALNVIHTFKQICREEGVAEGIAALYAYESQIPEVCISKIDGLKKHYGMVNPVDWKYFSIHIAADQEHAAVERRLLANYVQESNAKSIKIAVNRILDVLWDFLSRFVPAEMACA